MVGERQGKGKGMDNYRNKNKSFTYIHAIVTIIIYRYNILALVAFYLSTLFFGVLVKNCAHSARVSSVLPSM